MVTKSRGVKTDPGGLAFTTLVIRVYRLLGEGARGME